MSSLKDDAFAIWQAGVNAVDSKRLVQSAVALTEQGQLEIAGQVFPAGQWERLCVIGAGKAGAGMVAGVMASLGGEAERLQAAGRLTGWVNVPADCVRPLPCSAIHLHAARPAGKNEPTEAGVAGTREMVSLASNLGPRDICLCLISGGGSALMPLPVDGVTLNDKQKLTRHLSGAGANIQELNTVRKQLSQVKGGGLASLCSAGCLMTLIISDVIGDPLDVIASGPTVADTSTAQEALDVLERFAAREAGVGNNVWDYLQRQAEQPQPRPSLGNHHEAVIGNNAVAVAAAAKEAQRRGYKVCDEPAEQLEGEAEDVGVALAQRAVDMRLGKAAFQCLVSGGEPTVSLAPPERRGRGGRNQQLVAAAWAWLLEHADLENLAILSGGTDGEDGPTDAAGACIGDGGPPTPLEEIRDHLRRNDAYSLFQRSGGLVQTGPTHTNVCDLRIVLAPSDVPA